MRLFFLLTIAALGFSACNAVRRAATDIPERGDAQILLSPPVLNVYNLSLGKDIQAATSLYGSTAGLNYWYASSRAFSVSGGGVMATTPFCPGGCELTDTATLARGTKQSALFISLQHHHLIGRWELGYGAYLGTRKWQIHQTDFDDIETITRQGYFTGAGPVLSLRYRIFTFLYTGLEYHPQVLKLSGNTGVGYNHMLNIGAQLRLPTRRK